LPLGALCCRCSWPCSSAARSFPLGLAFLARSALAPSLLAVLAFALASLGSSSLTGPPFFGAHFHCNPRPLDIRPLDLLRFLVRVKPAPLH